MKKKNLDKKLGFSFFEMSIVILVISILIGTIAKGSLIIQKSRISAANSLTKSSPIFAMDNIVAWYETTMENSIKKDDIANNQINIWYDISNSGENNNAIAGNGPSYLDNAINNLPAIHFDGQNNYLNFSGYSLIQSDYTIVIVEERLDNKSSNYFIGGNGAGANRVLILGYRDNDTIAFSQYSNDYDANISGFSVAMPKIHIFRFSQDIGKDYYLNGNPQTLVAASGSPNPNQGLLSYINPQIGRFMTNQYYYGNIGEIILFKEYINDDDRRDIENYLSKKWSIELES